MKSKLLIVLNNEIPLGKVMNAIGHMMVGVAPRIPQDKLPLISIYSASGAAVRDFRHLSEKLHFSLGIKESAFSDFAHTTTEGSARDHATQTRVLPEKDIHYFASCICAEEEKLFPVDNLLEGEGYKKIKGNPGNREIADFDLAYPIEYPEFPDFTDQVKKFSIVLDKKLDTPLSIYTTVRSCIQLCNKVERATLRLHVYPDADDCRHPGMSEYGLVVLKAKKPNCLENLKNTLPVALDSHHRYYEAESLASIALFGDKALVDQTTKKDISLWSGKLAEKDFEIPLVDDLAEKKPAYLKQYPKAISDQKAATSSHPEEKQEGNNARFRV